MLDSQVVQAQVMWVQVLALQLSLQPKAKAKAIAESKAKEAERTTGTANPERQSDDGDAPDSGGASSSDDPIPTATPCTEAGGRERNNMPIGIKSLIEKSTPACACPVEMANTLTADGRFDAGGITDADTEEGGGREQ